MVPPVPPRAIGIAGWLATLALATVGMLLVRQRLNEAHVALVYLLVVLGSSAYAGRTLGLLVAGIAFTLFDWFFLPPYGTLAVANPLDWLVLVAFLGTQRRGGAAAVPGRRRRPERRRNGASRSIVWLFLGAETLNAGRAQDSLPAIADVIRTTLAVDWCEVYVRALDTGKPVLGARSPMRPDSSAGPALTEGQLVRGSPNTTRMPWSRWTGPRASRPPSRLASGRRRALATRTSGPRSTWPAMRCHRSRCTRHFACAIAWSVCSAFRMAPTYRFGISRRWVLRALSYYAALSVERVRLVRDAEHAEALREAAKLKDAVLASVCMICAPR